MGGIEGTTGFHVRGCPRNSISTRKCLTTLTQKDILQAVYNAGSPGEIEILIRPSNKQELAFKLRTSDRPFALIKIGDISGWLKDKLAGYEVIEGFEDEGFFERLNC